MTAYDKTVWKSGDLITAAKMNKIENQLETLTNTTPSGGAGAVQDVQIDSTSILSNDGIANIPMASATQAGVIKATATYGIKMVSNSVPYLATVCASDSEIKFANTNYNTIVPTNQHTSVFYGLARAAGDTTQKSSFNSNPVGVYTESAQSAIHNMLSAPVTVSGSTPIIAAKNGIQYLCGEVSSLNITLPASGIVDVVFTSGTTPAVLTITAPTGVTLRWANSFDPSSLDANTTYEINILNGLGVAASWT